MQFVSFYSLSCFQMWDEGFLVLIETRMVANFVIGLGAFNVFPECIASLGLHRLPPERVCSSNAARACVACNCCKTLDVFAEGCV